MFPVCPTYSSATDPGTNVTRQLSKILCLMQKLSSNERRSAIFTAVVVSALDYAFCVRLCLDSMQCVSAETLHL
jgi:hypothetical protein